MKTVSIFVVSLFVVMGPSLYGEDCYEYITRWGQSDPGMLIHPQDVAVDSSGYAYVIDAGHIWGRVIKYTPYSEGSDIIWETNSFGGQNLGYPGSIEIDQKGHVYVADNYYDRVIVYDQITGSEVGWFGGCQDPSHAGAGHWHTANSSHQTQTVPEVRNGPGEFHNAIGLATDGYSYLYVGDCYNNRVQKLEICQDSAGHLFLDFVGWFGGCDHLDAHSPNDRMHTGTSAHLPVRGSGNGFMYQVNALSVYGSTVFVVDGSDSPYLQTFSTYGSFQTEWNHPSLDNGSNKIAVDSNGKLFLTNVFSKQVSIYPSRDNLSCQWGSYGSSEGQWIWPNGITVDDSAIVYVVDADNHCVNVFRHSGSPPEADAGPDQNVEATSPAGAIVTLDGSGSSDDGEPHPLTWTWTWSGGFTTGINPTITLPLGTTTVTLTVDDGEFTDTDTLNITVADSTGPVITLNGAATVTLECMIDDYEELSATASDNYDTTVEVVIGGDTVDTTKCRTYIVTYDATDSHGNVATQVTRTVVVQDTTAPVITIVAPVPYGLYAEGDLVLDFSATDLVDGEILPPALSGELTDAAGFSGSVVPGDVPGGGVYTLTVTAEDQSGNEATETVLFVVYDPTDGFVTGGGWIWSPAAAYVADPALEGKANFGFVAKYKKGATVPIGQTEFVFQAGDLNFHSSSYEWLVVTGSNYARFKGWGSINGYGEYLFMLWAGDSPDTFRIKIWWEDGETENVVYDNGMDQEIGGGSIVVHAN